MKQIFKITTYSLFIALTLSTTHAFGMKSLFEESKEQEFFTPGTQQRSQQMPPASSTLTPQAIQGLVIATQAASHNTNIINKLEFIKESLKELEDIERCIKELEEEPIIAKNDSNEPLFEEHKAKVKEHTIVKDYRNAPLFKLLYDILTTMPPELINIIIDYAKNELAGKLILTKNTGMNTGNYRLDTLSEIAPGIIAYMDRQEPLNGSEKLIIFDSTTGKQIKEITSMASYFWGLLNDGIIESALSIIFQKNHLFKGFTIDAILSLSNETLALGSNDGIIILLNWKTNSIKKIINNAHNKKPIIALTKLSDHIFLSADDKKINIWDIYGNLIKWLERNSDNNEEKIRQLVILSNHEIAIIISNLGIEIWNLDTSKITGKIYHASAFYDKIYDDGSFSTHHLVLAAPQILATTVTSPNESNIYLWNLQTQQLQSTINTDNGIAKLLAIPDPINNELIVGSHHGILAIYDPQTCKLKKKFKAHDYAPATFSSLILLSNNRIASGHGKATGKMFTLDSEIKIWE